MRITVSKLWISCCRGITVGGTLLLDIDGSPNTAGDHVPCPFPFDSEKAREVVGRHLGLPISLRTVLKIFMDVAILFCMIWSLKEMQGSSVGLIITGGRCRMHCHD